MLVGEQPGDEEDIAGKPLRRYGSSRTRHKGRARTPSRHSFTSPEAISVFRHRGAHRLGINDVPAQHGPADNIPIISMRSGPMRGQPGRGFASPRFILLSQAPG
jgi:hypothetical protein